MFGIWYNVRWFYGGLEARCVFGRACDFVVFTVGHGLEARGRHGQDGRATKSSCGRTAKMAVPREARRGTHGQDGRGTRSLPYGFDWPQVCRQKDYIGN